MSNYQHIQDQLNEMLRAYSPFYRESVTRWLEDSDGHGDWYYLNAVRSFDPMPVTLEGFHQMAPYTAFERQAEVFAASTDKGQLEKVGEDAYRLTDAGRDLVDGFFQRAHEGLSEVKPLPEADMAQLADLLRRLVMAAINAPEPADKYALLASRWTDPGESSALATRLDQYVTDLYRFREDAHLAAWKQFDVGGQLWETLTLVWREEANTAAELIKTLPHRGYSADDYSAALAQLAARGWIEEREDQFQVTDAGRNIRETAERETDRIYYSNWSALTPDELALIDELLTRANKNLWRMGWEVYWDLALGVSRAIFSVTRSAIQPLVEKYFENPSTFFPLLLATGNSPEPMSATMYANRQPYVNPSRTSKLLAESATKGYLSKVNGGFSVTEAGVSAINEVNDAFYTYLGEIDPLAGDGSGELAGLLQRLVEACLKADEPANKWAITNSNNSHPEKEYGFLARIDQYLDDLNAFRDDAHIASWKPYGVDGRSWESMTLFWRKEVSSAADLVEKLTVRQYSEEEYAQSLKKLEELGWLAKSAGGYQVTEKGQEIRQKAEEMTNECFFTPWSCLDSGEMNRLLNLLVRMKFGLEKLAEEEPQPEGS